MEEEIEQISRLIGDIYDASLDPALWPAAFEKTCKYVGGSSVQLISQNVVGNVTQVYFTWGIEPNYAQLYLGKYRKLNPVFPMILLFGVEENSLDTRLSPSRGVLPNTVC